MGEVAEMRKSPSLSLQNTETELNAYREGKRQDRKLAADFKQLKEKTNNRHMHKPNQREGKNCLQGRKIGNRQTHSKKIMRTELERGVNGDSGRFHFLTQHSSAMVVP